jgi:hypothetical protein
MREQNYIMVTVLNECFMVQWLVVILIPFHIYRFLNFLASSYRQSLMIYSLYVRNSVVVVQQPYRENMNVTTKEMLL